MHSAATHTDTLPGALVLSLRFLLTQVEWVTLGGVRIANSLVYLSGSSMCRVFVRRPRSQLPKFYDFAVLISVI